MKEQHKHILQNTALLSIGSIITRIGYTDISRDTRRIPVIRVGSYIISGYGMFLGVSLVSFGLVGLIKDYTCCK